MDTQAIINLIGNSKGRGLPKWFPKDYVMVLITLHDQCKAIDNVIYRCRKLFDDEGMAKVYKLREPFKEAVKNLSTLSTIAYYCQQDNREPNEEEADYISKYLTDHSDSVKDLLTNGPLDFQVKE